MTEENQNAETGAEENTGQEGENQEQATEENTEAGGEGDKKTDDSGKNAQSLLNNLEDGEGVTFDFTTGEKPEGFPDDYWNEEAKAPDAQKLYEGLKKQEQRANDLRAKMGKGEHKAPAKPEDYKLELPEEIASQLNEGDKTIAAAQKRAHEHGISQEAFQGFMAGMVGDLYEIAQAVQDPNSEEAQARNAEYVKEQIKEIGPNGPQILRAVEGWGDQMLAEGIINETDLDTLKNEGLVSAKMVTLFNRLRSRMGGADIPHNNVDDGLPPDSEIADMIDKAYASKDQAQIRKAEALLDKRRAAGRPERLQF